ncbi:GSU2403 family nucleotidyltransferase fold protein [Ruegeria sp. 2205SS24-7]|uniref:GSU2403 family nucleotidyltransferase fold protein n=1 Tax=Ruegeria discodermiae TaxID=3064389 RepID=UPI0027406B3F|nr:GSU2403 family nucleotidyltransferase fold protein [Ruegeria sp. 2205SS24-7]MDP5217104.1 GSU2403 family nucleotidyltransferase fold protein [Ruegeria sp. 2205SS24-7]
MADSYPLAVQTTYRDLLDRHLRRPRPDVPGSILLVSNKGGAYWVARQRVGQGVVEQRIGPDTTEIRAQAERLKVENDKAQDWNRDAGALVAQLRAARMPVPTAGTGKLINALDRAGFFAEGGVLAGTHAFGLYALELGVRLEDALALTEDVDIAATKAVRVLADETASLTRALDVIGLRPVAGPMEPHPVRWETADGVVLDILTPKRRGGEAVVHHDGLGVWAQALPYLDYLLADPIAAVLLYREGVLVRIPAPERYAVHKLIVASARTGTHRAKSDKDLHQAAALIRVLADARPYELAAAYDVAKANGPKWRSAIAASLRRREDIAAILDDLHR